MSSLKTLQARLAWAILEYKFLYYEGPKFGLRSISDEQYDKLEDIYKKVSRKLNLKPTASDMVGFDYNRPSCRLVSEQMKNNKGKSRLDIFRYYVKFVKAHQKTNKKSR